MTNVAEQVRAAEAAVETAHLDMSKAVTSDLGYTPDEVTRYVERWKAATDTASWWRAVEQIVLIDDEPGDAAIRLVTEQYGPEPQNADSAASAPAGK